MFSERAVRLLFRTFNELPQNCKPRAREWVPLTGVIAQLHDSDESLAVISLATGMKCMPKSKIPFCKGGVLHDSHSEVLAMRGFNTYLLNECHRSLLDGNYESPLIGKCPSSNCDYPFALKGGVKLHVVSTELPCGDASMESVVATQQDSTPWVLPASDATLSGGDETRNAMLQGRRYFSELGRIRTKPGRADSPPTLSKSCTDKLASKQALSLLQSTASLLVQPSSAYIHSLILPDYLPSGESCDRAFSVGGRLGALAGRKWEGGYEMRYFLVELFPKELLCDGNDGYEFTRDQVSLKHAAPAASSNISMVYLPLERPPHREVIVNGVLMGRKAFSGTGASTLSKLHMWRIAIEIAVIMQDNVLLAKLDVKEYSLLKSVHGAARRAVKRDLRGVLTMGVDKWERNGDVGGDDFNQDGNSERRGVTE